VVSEVLNTKFAELFSDMARAWREAPAPAGIHLAEVTRSGLADVEAVAVIHGWMARVIRSGEAALLLADSGYAEEASPLVRSMLEHAIGLWWLVDKRGDALQVLVRQKAYQMERLEKVQEIGWRVSGDEGQRLLREAIEVETDEATKSLDRFAAVAEQAREYGLGMFLQAWMIESWTSHASLASARAYYDHERDADGSISEVPLLLTPVEGHREMYAAVASATHTALMAYNKLLPDEPLTQALTQWQQRFETLGAELTEETGGMPPRDGVAASEP